MQLTDAQLHAYLEGEAGPLVARAIARSPELQQRAEVLRAAQRSLATRLFRQSCPDGDTLGDYYMEMLPKERLRNVAQHIATCQYCARELIQFRQFVGALPQKRSLADRLKIWLTQSGGSAETLHPALALRGSERVQLFEADDIQIAIDVQPAARDPEQRALVGTIHGALPTDLAVDFWLNDHHEITTTTDAIGSFAVDRLAPGRYDLILRGDRTLIHLPAVEI